MAGVNFCHQKMDESSLILFELSCSDEIKCKQQFLHKLLTMNLIRVFSMRYIALVRWPPCELNISCTSTTAESIAKIWY